MERIFAIGDIHGCAAELDVLLASLDPGPRDTLCFLGDYVDRGPDARGVIARLLELDASGPRCHFLKGNHEDMFLSFLGREGRYGEAFIDNGGATTLRSYGLVPRWRPDLAQDLPADHLRFLDGLEISVELGHCLCVHAGVRPSLPLDRQRIEDLLWIREDFFGRPHRFDRTIVYGHTPRREVAWDVPYRIGLDTGLVYGGALSCLELRTATLRQVQRHARTVVTTDVSDRLGDRQLA